jgi:hypothetical protein
VGVNEYVICSCEACGYDVRFGYYRVWGKPYFFFSKGKELRTKEVEVIRRLIEVGHLEHRDYKVDPIYGVDVEILGVYLADVFHRPGVKPGGSREKVKGKGTPIVRVGRKWWETEDPYQLERETRDIHEGGN